MKDLSFTFGILRPILNTYSMSVGQALLSEIVCVLFCTKLFSY